MMPRAACCLLLLAAVVITAASSPERALVNSGRSLHFFLPGVNVQVNLGGLGHWGGVVQPAVQLIPAQPQPVITPPASPIPIPPAVTPSPITQPLASASPVPLPPVTPAPFLNSPPSPVLSPPLPSPVYSPPPPSPAQSPPIPPPQSSPQPSPVASSSPTSATGPQSGLTAGTIVTGFQQGDTSKAAHAIADSSSNGQASDALGQLYHNANDTGLESNLAKKIADTMSQASKFNLDAAARAHYNGASKGGYSANAMALAAACAFSIGGYEGMQCAQTIWRAIQLPNSSQIGLVQPSSTAPVIPTNAVAEQGSSADAMALAAARAFSIGRYEAAQDGGSSADAMALAAARAFIGGGDQAAQFAQTIQRAIQLYNCSDGLQATLAEAQSLASSQAGDAGAAAFSDAVYNYMPIRMCLGGRAMQAENAADGKPLNPQPPPPPPSGGTPPSEPTVSLNPPSMPNTPPSQPSSIKGRKLFQLI